MFPRRFALVRHIDYTGVSGVGVVAYGVMFFDGHVTLRWCSDHPATSLWESIDDLIAVHGHGNATSVQWIDDASERLQQVRDAFRAQPDSHAAIPTPTDGAAHRDLAHEGLIERQPLTDDQRVPAQRRSAGRHRRAAQPSEESAGQH